MKDAFTKKAGAYFHAESRELETVFAKIQQLEMLNEQIKPLLDATLASYCQVANVINDKLILIAANGSIATQIRFQTNDLLRKFQSIPLLQSIRQIECKVRPNVGQIALRQADAKATKMPPLSIATSEMIKEIADTIEDEKLRAIMLRIAEHTN